MLPVTLQFLIAMIASSINDRAKRKLDYALEEVRVLRDTLQAATGSMRIPFSPDQRRRLALAGKELSPAERRQCCQIVKPGTILDWLRELAARKYDSSSTTEDRTASQGAGRAESRGQDGARRTSHGATRRSGTRFAQD